MSRQVEVPLPVLAWAVRAAEVGELPLVLAPTPAWRPRENSADVDAQARAACAGLGWLDRKGRFDAETVATLRIVCGPQLVFHGYFRDRDHTTSAQASAIGQRGVLAVRTGDSVRLTEVGSTKLPERLVAQTPDVRAGAGRPVQAPVTELDRLTPDGRRKGRVVTGKADAGTRAVGNLLDTTDTGGGELHVAACDAVGRRTACPTPVRYVDTAQGRYVYRQEDGHGGLTVAIEPASRATLTTLLKECHRTLMA